MSNKLILNAITTALMLGAASMSLPILADTESMGDTSSGMERCYGVSRAGQNDCGTGSYKCAGESKVDADRQAWINMPTGLCHRIVGGTTKPPREG
jgi:uncharacterized membrane protein